MNKTLNNIFKGDKVIWMIFLLLCVISIVEVYSASSQLTYENGSYLKPVAKHIGLLIVGVGAMIVTMNIPCKYFKVALPFLLASSILLLVGVYFAGAVNDGHRWINILGIKFQPSEIGKGTMQTEHGADRLAFKYVLTVWFMIVPLIFFENLSTAVLLSAVVYMMMIIGRVPVSHLGKLLGVALLGITLALSAIMLLGNDKEREAEKEGKAKTELVTTTTDKKEENGIASKLLHRMDTWKSRIDKFFDTKELTPKDIDLDADAQRAHANIAIVSSGIKGKGPGNSEECDHLSQAYSDFIFAIIIEEMGIFGAIFVASLYMILLVRTGYIANRCENNFPAYLAMGLALMLVTQALFNMMVSVGLAPITGQPLPLISKGGTSSIINCIYLGAILSISRTAQKRSDLVSNSSNNDQGTPVVAQPAAV